MGYAVVPDPKDSGRVAGDLGGGGGEAAGFAHRG